MTDSRQEPTGKKTLGNVLLAIDGWTPSLSVEGREVAKEALRRDRRRVRILMGLTIGLFLLTVLGICFCVGVYYLRVVPGVHRFEQELSVLQQQFAKQYPQPSEPDLLQTTACVAAVSGKMLFRLQLANVWAISALFVVMVASAFCTVLLIMASRRATLRQIQVSLLVLSEQLDALQRALQDRHARGGS